MTYFNRNGIDAAMSKAIPKFEVETMVIRRDECSFSYICEGRFHDGKSFKFNIEEKMVVYSSLFSDLVKHLETNLAIAKEG
jgi:hypothetical protein